MFYCFDDILIFNVPFNICWIGALMSKDLIINNVYVVV